MRLKHYADIFLVLLHIFILVINAPSLNSITYDQPPWVNLLVFLMLMLLLFSSLFWIITTTSRYFILELEVGDIAIADEKLSGYIDMFTNTKFFIMGINNEKKSYSMIPSPKAIGVYAIWSSKGELEGWEFSQMFFKFHPEVYSTYDLIKRYKFKLP